MKTMDKNMPYNAKTGRKRLRFLLFLNYFSFREGKELLPQTRFSLIHDAHH